MTLKEIKKVGIAGAGTLGLRVGLQMAISHFEVVIFDLSADQLRIAEKIQDMLLHKLIEAGELAKKDIDEIKSNISFTTNPDTLANNADLVNESITEDLETKQQFYTEMAPLWPPHTLLTTNTSYLLPSQLSAYTGRPSLFCAFHFHDVFAARVVDIMPHSATAKWIPELLTQLGKRMNQIPVMVEKETKGYLYNALLIALLGAAGNLVTKEVAKIEAIDKSWMGNMNLPIGPFGIIDQIGLDTAWHVIKERKDAKSIRFAALLKSYIDQGKLGQKSGAGFYNYPLPAFAQPGFID